MKEFRAQYAHEILPIYTRDALFKMISQRLYYTSPQIAILPKDKMIIVYHSLIASLLMSVAQQLRWSKKRPNSTVMKTDRSNFSSNLTTKSTNDLHVGYMLSLSYRKSNFNYVTIIFSEINVLNACLLYVQNVLNFIDLSHVMLGFYSILKYAKIFS